MVDWYLGTMGFAYSDWRGVFYPTSLAPRYYLKHYSRIFNAVEIDSTFYGTPRPESVVRWYHQTPAHYQFCLKTPQRITHELALVAAWDEMSAFIDTVSLLGEKLGVILLQFPPSFAVETHYPNLVAFLEERPAHYTTNIAPRFAIEFRHQSWYTAGVTELLSEHQVCWAGTEYPNLPAEIRLTADFVYFRWIGQHGRYERHDHERIDPSQQLASWWEHIQPHLPGISAVYGFFNNDYAGFAPATCNRFKRIAGLPDEPFEPPKQATLF